MKVPNNLVYRAVDLWCKALLNPIFDNGDNGEVGAMTAALGEINIAAELKIEPNLSAKIEVFRKDLTSRIEEQLNSNSRRTVYLDTDYAPSGLLAESARAAGIPGTLFSIKSHVSICDDSVSSTFGYSSERSNHYPLFDGRWLVTTLTGSDMTKIINQIETGQDLGLTIEKDTHIICPKCHKISHSAGDIDNKFCRDCGFHEKGSN